MSHRTTLMILTCSILAQATTAAWAAEKTRLTDGMTGEQIIDAVENREDGKDMISSVALEHRTKDGTVRLRRLTMMRKEFDDQTKWVVFFHAPPEVRNTGFLVWDLKNDQDRRWVYVPSVSQVRRLSVGDERKAFFGTDFVYEDLTNRDASNDTHTIIGSEKYKDWDCFIVESKPKNPRLAEFFAMRRWVWKEDPIALRMELYDQNGKAFKAGRVESLDETQGIVNIRLAMLKDLVTGTQTKMVIENYRYNTGIADQAFSEQQLSRGAP